MEDTYVGRAAREIAAGPHVKLVINGEEVTVAAGECVSVAVDGVENAVHIDVVEVQV